MAIRGFTHYTESQMIQFGNWKKVVSSVYETHGFNPFTPRPVERLSDLTKKGGINHQIFSINQIQNEGEAKYGLPFDRTVPFAIWANHYSHQLSLPYKRYDINYSFRGESAQAGRYRGFYQADVDIVDKTIGSLSEAECIATVYQALKKLEIGDYVMYLNNIQISKAIAGPLNLSPENLEKFLRIIDKIEKQPEETSLQEIMQLDGQLKIGAVREVFQKFKYKGPLKEFLSEISNSESVSSLKKVFEHLYILGLDPKNILFNPSMVRGLDYYTGVVFETFLENGKEYGSIASGGRYDNLVDGWSNKTQMEGVGGSIGLTRLYDVYLRLKGDPTRCSIADVIVFGREDQHMPYVLEVVKELRTLGCCVDLYTGESQTIKKKLDYANKKGIPYVFIVMDENSFVVKDMYKKSQEDLAAKHLAVRSVYEKLKEEKASLIADFA